ncbi:MAG: biopolymer transport protein ExbD [Phycisphaerales bacterium]
MRRVRRTTTPEVRLDLAPLIDVVFLLLTFFLFAMLLMVRADVLDIRLPEIASGNPAAPSEPITVGLMHDGSLQVQGEPIELAALTDRLVELRDTTGSEGDAPKRPVLLAVDERCDSGTLIRVIDALTGAGIADFAVLGTPAESPTPEQSLPGEGSSEEGPSP